MSKVIGNVSPGLGNDLGLASIPGLETILAHFERVLEQCSDGRLPERQRFRTGQILHRIYAFFGRSFGGGVDRIH